MMQIGVMSDTHNNLSNLLYALAYFRDREITTIIHCGDLTDFELISHFYGFQLIYLFGNVDADTGVIRKRVKALNAENFAGLVFRGQLGEAWVAATHSHIEGQLMALVQEQRYNWIFHGHTHQRRDEVVQEARIVNPGALGGLKKGPRSFCLVDLDASSVDSIVIPERLS